MDRLIRWLGFRLPVLLILVGIGCTADVPSIGNDGGIDLVCTPYADLLVAFTTSAGAEDGSAALNAPDGAVITLSTNDVLTVGWAGLGSIINNNGDDIRIHGSAATGSTVAYVSNDGENYEYLGTLEDGSLDFDLGPSKLNVIRYARLVGQSGQVTIDALESISTPCP